MAVAPIDYSRLVFAGIMGFLLFGELPDRYTLVGAAIIVGSTLYIAYRETYLSRTHRAVVAVRPIAAPRRTPTRRNLIQTRLPVTRSARCRRHRCAVERHPRCSGAYYRAGGAPLRSKGRKQAALFSRHHCVSCIPIVSAGMEAISSGERSYSSAPIKP